MASKELSFFLDAIIGLKYVQRSGWHAKVGITKPESVADHSYAMAAVGMMLSDAIGLDTKKVLKMIILHDLAESLVGDYMPGEVTRIQKQTEEKNAMKKILASLPSKVKREYSNIWLEYLKNKTETARFVHRIDKLEMALQAARYLKDGHDERLLRQFFESARMTVDNGDGGKKKDLLIKILKDYTPSASAVEILGND